MYCPRILSVLSPDFECTVPGFVPGFGIRDFRDSGYCPGIRDSCPGIRDCPGIPRDCPGIPGFGILAKTEIGLFEVHLLFCPSCQDRLAETEEFVIAMRAAAAECLEKTGN